MLKHTTKRPATTSGTPSANGHNPTPKPQLLTLLDATEGAIYYLIESDDAEAGAAFKRYFDEKYCPAEHQKIVEALLTQIEKGIVCNRNTTAQLLAEDDHAYRLFFEILTRKSGAAFEDCLHTFNNARKAKAQTPRPFRLLAWDEITARPDPQWLIGEVLPACGTSLLSGKHGSYKSFLALDMALHVATGRDWHGHEVAEAAPGIYVCAEGIDGLKKRVLVWLKEYGNPSLENFRVIERPPQIHNARDLAELLDELRAGEVERPALIVLDTLARHALGLEENSSRDMGQLVDAADCLKAQTGAHVMFVHHNNKAGEYRGSSALPAGVDTEMSVKKEGAKGHETLKLHFDKQKNIEEPRDHLFVKRVVPVPGNKRGQTSLVFHLEATRDESGDTLTENDRQVLGVLQECFAAEGATSAQWFASCESDGIAPRTFHRSKQRLHSQALVTCGEAGKRGARYFPTKTGDEN